MTISAIRPTRGNRGDAVVVDAERAFDAFDFRRAMGRFATGVTVVTMVGPDGEAYGITINAFMSVSLEPPLIAVSIGKKARAHATMAASERFAVSVLGEDQRNVSDRFAGRPAPEGAGRLTLLDGFPVVEGAVAHIVCRMHSSFEAGDHTIYIGEVQALRTAPGGPLVFQGGRYAGLESHQSEASD